MISGVSATSGAVQQQFQIAAIKSEQQMMAQQMQTLMSSIEPGKGSRIDAYA